MNDHGRATPFTLEELEVLEREWVNRVESHEELRRLRVTARQGVERRREHLVYCPAHPFNAMCICDYDENEGDAP